MNNNCPLWNFDFFSNYRNLQLGLYDKELYCKFWIFLKFQSQKAKKKKSLLFLIPDFFSL